jgi:hypothetical protein
MHVITNAIWPKPSIINNTAVADQRLTVSNTALAFATTFNAITQLVVLDVQNADVMCTFDGSDPTTTNGHRLYSGTAYTWSKAMAQSAKFIRQASTDAAIHASEFQI